MQRKHLVFAAIAALAAPTAAFAQAGAADPGAAAKGAAVDSATPTSTAPPTLPHLPKPPEEQPPPTLNVDVGVASVYVFRGLNLFQKDSQWNQHAFASPSLTFNVPGTNGLTIGYWGAYQLVGTNVREKLDAGTGGENDLTASYSRKLGDKLTAGAGLTSYIYPFAKKDAAGTRVPLYLEPFAFATLSSALDVGLKVTYFHGVQEAVKAYRYVYFNPSLAKTIELSKRVSFNPTASVGYKLFTDQSTPVSEANTVDVLVGAALPVTLSDTFYLKPSVCWAWTNLPEISLKKEMVAFGGVNVGANF